MKKIGHIQQRSYSRNYLFRLQVTSSLGASDADTIKVNVVDDSQNANTVTYHDLVWEAGDVYGLGSVDIFQS